MVVTVVDSLSGEPAEGVEVRLLPRGSQNAGAPSVTTFTNVQGTTRLSVEDGEWTLRLRGGAFAQADIRLSETNHADTLIIRLRRIAFRMPEKLALAVAAPSPPGATTLAPVELRRYPHRRPILCGSRVFCPA